MAIKKKRIPDLFAEEGLDPVQTATGYPPSSRGASPTAGSVVKKKAGFYLSVNILDRFSGQLDELTEEGLLDVLDGSIVLNRDGLLCVDNLLHDFFLEQHKTDRIV